MGSERHWISVGAEMTLLPPVLHQMPQAVLLDYALESMFGHFGHQVAL